MRAFMSFDIGMIVDSGSIQMDFLRCVFFCEPSDLKASQKQAHTGRKDTVSLFVDVFDAV